jgi:hypothetical protein
MDENFTTDQVRVLAAQIAQRLIALYGANALEEALNVVAMLVELGREELIPVWRRAALDIAEIGRRTNGVADAA